MRLHSTLRCVRSLTSPPDSSGLTHVEDCRCVSPCRLSCHVYQVVSLCCLFCEWVSPRINKLNSYSWASTCLKPGGFASMKTLSDFMNANPPGWVELNRSKSVNMQKITPEQVCQHAEKSQDGDTNGHEPRPLRPQGHYNGLWSSAHRRNILLPWLAQSTFEQGLLSTLIGWFDYQNQGF